MSIQKDQSNRRELTRRERKSLEKFARLEITLVELQQSLGELLKVSFGEEERHLSSEFILPKPAIQVKLKHIHDAMGKHERGEISTKELSEWATMLLLNEAYDWQGKDEDVIADWLNEMSLLTLQQTNHKADEY